jgi:glycerol uptake facilitator-like aquaporin
VEPPAEAPPPEYCPWQRAAAEAIDTFFLVFVGAGTAAMTLILAYGAPRYNQTISGSGRSAVRATGSRSG